MSFEEFIVKYYGWVLAVLAILIVTIIGFIADKKSKKKKEGMNMNEQNMQSMQNNQFMPNNDVNTMPNMNMEPTPVQAQSINPSMDMPNMNMGSVSMPNSNVNPSVNMESMVQGSSNMQMPNIVSPTIEPAMSSVPNQDDFGYKPLSEQTPNIPPRFEGMPNNNMNATINPMPTMESPIVNTTNDFNQTPVQNVMPSTPVQPVNMNMAPPVQPTMPTNNMQQYAQPEVVQPTMVMPQPEVIQPINPEPIPLTQEMPAQNVNMAMPNMNVNQMPSQQPMQNPVNNAAEADVNNMFVTGNTNNIDNNNNNPW